jgi:hypothetical protein
MCCDPFIPWMQTKPVGCSGKGIAIRETTIGKRKRNGHADTIKAEVKIAVQVITERITTAAIVTIVKNGAGIYTTCDLVGTLVVQLIIYILSYMLHVYALGNEQLHAAQAERQKKKPDRAVGFDWYHVVTYKVYYSVRLLITHY